MIKHGAQSAECSALLCSLSSVSISVPHTAEAESRYRTISRVGQHICNADLVLFSSTYVSKIQQDASKYECCVSRTNEATVCVEKKQRKRLCWVIRWWNYPIMRIIVSSRVFVLGLSLEPRCLWERSCRDYGMGEGWGGRECTKINGRWGIFTYDRFCNW